MFTLQDNIKKQQNLLAAIQQFTRPEIYYHSSYKPQANCDKANYRHLQNTTRKLKRLSVVIAKQTKDWIKENRYGKK